MLNAAQIEVCINLSLHHTYNNRMVFFDFRGIAENTLWLALAWHVRSFGIHSGSSQSLAFYSCLLVNKHLNFPCELLVLESIQSQHISQENEPSLTSFQEISHPHIPCVCVCVLIE